MTVRPNIGGADAPTTVENADVTVVGGAGHVGVPLVLGLAEALRAVKTPLRVLICYDHEDDDTLLAIRDNRASLGALAVSFVRNSGRGAHGAVLSGFAASKAPFAVVLPADDDYNAGILDAMVARAEAAVTSFAPAASSRAAA